MCVHRIIRCVYILILMYESCCKITHFNWYFLAGQILKAIIYNKKTSTG